MWRGQTLGETQTSSEPSPASETFKSVDAAESMFKRCRDDMVLRAFCAEGSQRVDKAAMV